jgi:hypothetical protein
VPTAELHGAGKLLVPAVVVTGALGEMATRVACEAVLAVVEVPGPSRSNWTQLTSPAAPPEEGPPKPERPLLLIWFLATFRTVTPQRVGGRAHTASVGRITSVMQEKRENARRAAVTCANRGR